MGRKPMNVFYSEKHGVTLFCGDQFDVLRDVSGIDCIFTSPPYNLGGKGSGVRKDGRRKFGLYDQKSFAGVHYVDNLDEEEYQKNQRESIAFWGSLLSSKGSIVYNHKNRHKNGVMISPTMWFPKKDCGVSYYDEVVLDRVSTHNHESSFFAPTTERLYIFRRSGAKNFFNKSPLAGSSLHERDVWRMPIVSGKKHRGHSASFDVSIADRVIHHFCPRGGLVCDPYSGSGTTMLSAVRSGRRFVGAEKDKMWFAKSIERLLCEFP